MGIKKMDILLEIYDSDNTDFRMELSKNLALVVYQLNKAGYNARFQNGGFVNKYFNHENQGFRLVVNKQFVLSDVNNFSLRNQVLKDEDIEPMKRAVVQAINGNPCNFNIRQ